MSSMKRPLTLALVLLVAVAVVALASTAIGLPAARHPAASEGSPTGSPTQPTRPAPSVTPQDPKADILRQIERLASEYADLVDQEERNGHLRPATGSDAGEGEFQFLDSSDNPLYPAWDDALSRIQALNEEYAVRYNGQLEPLALATPDVRPTNDDDIQRLIDAASAEYVAWLETEQETGSTVSMFDPYEMRYQSILVGESYVSEQLRWAALLDFRLELLTPPLEQRQTDIDAIQRVFPGEVRLEDVGGLLPMYTDHQLHLYRAGEWRVIIDPVVHRIMLIDREPQAGGQHEPPGQGGLPGAPTPADLENRAVEFAQLAAPGIDLARLTPVYNQKGDNSFFRWEDRTRPLLPDGRSYPFIQVALSADGELLNYYNTL